jgi:cellulose synthase (UDP-forming)
VKIKREFIYTWLAIGVTSISFAFFLGESITDKSVPRSWWAFTEFMVFLAIVCALVLGNLIFQFARLGYLQRRAAHHPAARAAFETVYDEPTPRLAVLIPSYKEEERVLLQTILSVALLEYPGRRIVVLIDDPPDVAGAELETLQATRRLVAELNQAFGAHGRVLHREQLAFLTRLQLGKLDEAAEAARLARSYEDLAAWLDAWAGRIAASSTPSTAHTDRLFIDRILRQPAADHRARAAHLRSASFDPQQAVREHHRLAALLTVEIESFERKRYTNLSHQPNKAMNLNSYIGLIGGCYYEVTHDDGLHLVECAIATATVRVPHADYLLTIDADSIVLPDYALRLVRIMEASPAIAVAQTPYSAFPGPEAMLERAAGATTDIQYIVHQGFTRYDATYWVGANAMLRLAALRDICNLRTERGHQIAVFIQDRTVIEDTGSTVDLIRRGWQLYNYPERLAYSATPPDFGALIIQRRRWSNGGLLILPDLLRHLYKTGRLSGRLPELAMRSYYLTTPAIANFGLLVLVLYRFDDSVSNWWLPLTAAPYYYLYGRDLRFAGYRWSDLLRVYALNLLLVPVNLAGVLRSLQQGLTGRKAPFGRTPKVEQRTRTPSLYILFQWFLLAYLAGIFIVDLVQGLITHAVFALVNIAFYIYGITAFLGWRNCYFDLRAGFAPVVRSPRRLEQVRQTTLDSPLPEPAPIEAAARRLSSENVGGTSSHGATGRG